MTVDVVAAPVVVGADVDSNDAVDGVTVPVQAARNTAIVKAPRIGPPIERAR